VPATPLVLETAFEIIFDLGHQGTAAGFEVSVLWGGTVLVDRVADAADSMMRGKVNSAVYSGGAQLRAESWGRRWAFAASVGMQRTISARCHRFSGEDAEATSETVSAEFYSGAVSGAVGNWAKSAEPCHKGSVLRAS